MPIELRWKTSISTTCLHAARVMHDGLRIADTELAELLHPAAESLFAEIEAAGYDARALLPRLCSLSAEFEANAELVTNALARLLGRGSVSESSVSHLAAPIGAMESALLHSRPELPKELNTRSRPLQAQWEALGPGLINLITRLTEPGFVAESAEVVLVAPVAGGHGYAYPLENRVALEAVLVNPHPQLPEVVRLAWLLAQMNADVPIYAEVIPVGRASTATLAAVPLVLEAAAELELVAGVPEALPDALDLWIGNQQAGVSQTLLDWWRTYRDGGARWRVALAALDQMLAST